MALTKGSFDSGEAAARAARTGDLPSAADVEPQFNDSPDNPDDVVQPGLEVPSQLVAEAQLRHQFAETDMATFQEKKQAAVERAHALSTRPDGSYAQLHETTVPTVAVADEQVVSELRADHERAVDALQGSAPAGSPAAVKADEQARQDRESASSGVKPDEPQPAPTSSTSAPSQGSGAKGSGSK